MEKENEQEFKVIPWLYDEHKFKCYQNIPWKEQRNNIKNCENHALLRATKENSGQGIAN